MTYFGPGHNLLRRGDFGQWASATREDGDSDQRSVGLNSLYINNLSTCLWVKFPIDNPLIRCVSGSYPHGLTTREARRLAKLGNPHSQPSGDASAPAACRSAKKKKEGD